MNHSVLKAIIIICALNYGSVVSAASLDNIQFIKIAAKDEKAVVKMPDGKLQVIKPGDVIGENVTVKEIASGRIVLEEKTGNGPDTVIVRLVNGKAKVERLRKQAGERPILVMPGKAETKGL
jgi:hypothetical protein